MTTPSTPKNPNPRTPEIYKFRYSSIAHHCYILSLYDLVCSAVEKKIFQDIMNFYDMNKMPTP